MNGEHLTDDQGERFRRRALTPEELVGVYEHLEHCERCRALVAADTAGAMPFAAFQADQLLGGGETIEHLTDEQLAGYVDDTLDRIDRSIVESHLEVCASCLEEARRLRSLRIEMSTYPERSVAPTDAPEPTAAPAPSDPPSRPGRFPSRWFTLSVGGLGIAALIVAYLFGRMTEQSRVHVLEWERARLAGAVGQERSDAARRVAQANEERNRALQERRQAEQALQEEQKQYNAQIQRIEKEFTDRHGNPPSGPGNRFANPFDLATLLGPLTVNRPSDLNAGQPIPTLGSNQGTALTLLDPIATLVLDDRPTLRWKPLPGADHYDVTVRRTGAPAGESLRSGPVVATGSPSWSIPQPLQRGGKYDWYVEATRHNGEPAYAHGQFRIADEQTVSTELARSAIAQLALGKLYAQDGLLDDAQRVFQSLANSDAPVPVIQEAQRLLKSLQDQRQAPRRSQH